MYNKSRNLNISLQEVFFESAQTGNRPCTQIAPGHRTVPARIPKWTPRYQNACPHAQTGTWASKYPPTYWNTRSGTKMLARVPKQAPRHQNARPWPQTCAPGPLCTQTGAQAPKINFNNKILKRLKRRRRRKKNKTVYRSRVKAITRLNYIK